MGKSSSLFKHRMPGIDPWLQWSEPYFYSCRHLHKQPASQTDRYSFPLKQKTRLIHHSVHGCKFFHEILIFPQEPYPSFLISGQAEIKIPYPSPNFPPKILIFHNPLPPSHFRKNIDCCLSPLSSLIWNITLPDAIDSFTLIHFGTEPGYIYKKGFLVLTIFDVFF